MDINILKIASDTKNNKHIHNCTHSMKYKSQICGDEIEIFLIIKDNVIKLSLIHISEPTRPY